MIWDCGWELEELGQCIDGGGWDRIDGDAMNSPPWDKCDMDSPHGTKVIKIILMGQK